MANIAVQRIKREFKEVLKSEEVRNELPDIPHLSPGWEGSSCSDFNVPGNPWVALLAVAHLPVGKQQSPPACFRRLPLPSPGPGMDRLAGGWSGEEHGLGGRWRRGHFLEGCEL